MAQLEFTCPKCGEETFAEVPPGGIRVKCPSCGKGLRLTLPGEQPDELPKRRQRDRRNDDEDKQTDQPLRRKRKKSQSRGGIPTWVWVSGGCGVVAVVALIGVLALGKTKKTDDQVANDAKPAVAPLGADVKQSGTTVNHPQGEAPRKEATPKLPSSSRPPKKEPASGRKAEIDQGWPALPTRKRRADAVNAPSRTIVRWLIPAASGAPLVVLDAPTEPIPPRPGPHRGIEAREIARQAILLMAREEFGANTRDEALGESAGDLNGYRPPVSFEMTWLVQLGKSATISIDLIEGEARRPVWNMDIPLPDAEVLDYLALTSALEAASRGPLPEAFARETKATRMPGKASSAKSPIEPVALSEVNYIDLLLSVRRLHAAVRGMGESPAILTDLARGYAALGLATEHLEIPAHKVFLARGLLYAHRAVARNAPEGKWVPAYAMCLAGHYGRALDLAQAAGGNPPPWAKVIEPTCRYDHNAIKALPPDQVGAIAGLLRFIAAENKYTPSHPIGIGLEFLQSHRDCFRVYDGVTKIAGLALVRSLTDAGPGVVSSSLAKRLARVSDLPPAGSAVLDKVGSRNADAERTLLRALDSAGTGEPSLAALAALVREERFRQLGHRVYVYSARLNLEAAALEEIRKALPFLVDHPRRDEFARRVAPAPKGQPNIADQPVPEELLYGERLAGLLTVAHADDSDLDCRAIETYLKPEQRPAYVAKFLKISPHSPIARFHLIRTDWAQAQLSAGAWEKEFAAQPMLLAALGEKYKDLGRYDDSERLFLAAAKLSPENRCYLALADIYGNVRKDEARMLAVMEERLKYPDYGLERARMRVRIAEVYAKRKDYGRALSYAEKAATDSGADWAMGPTIYYAGLLGDKSKAALWEQRRRQRYGGGSKR